MHEFCSFDYMHDVMFSFWVLTSHSGECEIQRFSKRTQMRAGRQGFTPPGIS